MLSNGLTRLLVPGIMWAGSAGHLESIAVWQTGNMKNISLSLIRRRALCAADWYVNSQIVSRKPWWDANDGRFVYNYHLPSRQRVSGLGWTQARGIMVLMAAHRLTGKGKYLDTAVRAAGYIKTTQIYDRAMPYFGAFGEEIPQSTYCWPRDGAETASGYLHLYHETGDRDLVRRAALYADWLLSVTDRKSALPPCYFYFNPLRKENGSSAFMAGSGMLYALLYRATGERRYLEEGLAPIARAVEDQFLAPDGGLVNNRESGRAVKGAAVTNIQPVLNDDGLCAALLAYALITRQHRVLEKAVRIADWMMIQPPAPVFCSLPSRLCYILDVARATGENRYREYVLAHLPAVLDLQVLASGDPCADGAFRGEDEKTEWYVAGAEHRDFVTNRVTCYAALTLFKLLNAPCTPGYSAFGWQRKPLRAARPRR